MNIPWLTVLALLPAVGAVVLIFSSVKAAKQVALAVSLITLAFALFIASQFKIGAGMQLGEQVPWIKPLGVYYALGLDGVGLTLVLLVVIITPVVIIASWRDFEPTGESVEESAAAADTAAPSAGTLAPKYDSRVFFALVLAVQSSALYLFLATDVFLFYVFFEVILIPMYFLIGGFGPGPRRTYAAAKFLIFGLLGGFVMLASIIGLYVQSARAG